MNHALWRRNVLEAAPLWLGCAVLLFGFHWLFVWLSSKIDLGALGAFLSLLPAEWQRVSPIPVADIATPAGRIGLAYVDPIAIFTMTAWGIARGSDAVSGELGRGTLEMVLAQPVRRVTVLGVQALVTTAGALLLGLASWLGTWAGLATVPLASGEVVSAARYLPAALNLFALSFFMAGVTTLLSSWDRYRWRTIGLAGGFYLVSLLFKITARMAPGLDWLIYFSFLGAFEPLLLVNEPHEAWRLSLEYDGLLVGLGLAAYVAAAVIFSRRDLPAPL